VIDFETYHEVRRLQRELNLTPSQIAATTGLNIKTIRKWLDKPRYEARSKGARRTSKLDAYKDLIVSWLEKHPYTGIPRHSLQRHFYWPHWCWEKPLGNRPGPYRPLRDIRLA
jgi:transposase